MPTPINISASRGASILTYYDKRLEARLSMSEYRTPVQIWLEIKESRDPGFCQRNNYELPVFEETAAIRWGKAFESAIIELAENKLLQEIEDREKFYRYHTDFDNFEQNILTCHIDGAYDTKILHEGKTTSYFYWIDNFGDPGTDRIPINYQIQCQHQMICTGAEKVILSVLVWPKRVDEWEEMGWEIAIFDDEGFVITRQTGPAQLYSIEPILWARTLSEMGYFHQYEIHADPELQNRMIADYTDWWERHIIGDEIPEPTHYDDIRALVREPKGTIIASPDVESLMSEYKSIKSEISGTGPLAKRAQMIKVGVLDYMRKHGADAVDEDSCGKMILRDRSGRKLATYGKDKNGDLYFR